MCVIVDVNVAHLVLAAAPDPEFAPVHGALFRTTPGLVASLVYGGFLHVEYARDSRVRAIVALLDRRGRTRKVDDVKVNAEQDVVEAMPCLTSDDPHIIALARVARVKLLCTRDAALTADFTNPRLVPGRCRVYRDTSHAHLVGRCCRRAASRKGKRSRA